MANCISRLSKREAEVIRLRYYRDMSQREVGDYLEISPARFSQVEKSAKKKLEDSLEKEGQLVA